MYISSSSLNSSPIFSVTQPCISRPVPWTVHLSSQLLNLVYLVQFLEQFTYLLSYSTLDISSSSLNSSPIFSVTQPCISRPVPWTVHLSSQLLNLVYLVQFLEQFTYLLSYSTLYISSSSLNSSPIFSVTQPCISRPVPWTVHLSSQLLNLVYLVQFLEQFTYLLSYSTLDISSSSLNSSPIFSVTQPCISRPVPWTVHLSSQLLNLVYLVQFLEQFTYLLSYSTLYISSSSLNSSPIFSVTQPCISRPVPWTVHLSSQLLNLVYLVQFLEQFTYLLSYSTLYISSSSLNSSPIFSVTQPCISRPVPWTVHLSSQLLNLVYLVQFLEQFTYLLSYSTLYISSSSLNSSPIFSVTQPWISRPVPWTVNLSSQLLNLVYLVQFLEQFTYLLSYSTLYISSSSLNSSPIFSVTQPCISRPVPWTVHLSSQLLNLGYLVQFLEQFTYLLSYSTLYISSSSLNSSPIFSVTQPCISRPVPWTVHLSSQLLNLVYLVQFLEQFTYLLSYSTLYISSSSLNSSPIFSVTQPCISRPVPWTVHLSSQLLNLVYLVQFLEQFTYLLSYSTLYISSSSLNSSPIFSVTQPCISRPVPWTVLLSSQLLNLGYLVQFLKQFTYLLSYSTLYISSSSLNSSPIFSVTQPCISRPVPWTVHLSSQLLNLVYLVQFLEQFTYLLSYSTLDISSSSLNSSPIFSVTQPCISRPVPWTVLLSSQLLNLVYLVQFLEQFTYLLSYSTLYISSSSLNSSPIFSVTQPCISRPVPWTVHLSSQLLNLVYLVQFLEQFTYLLSYSTLDISSSSLNSSPIFSVTQPCISRPVPWTVHLSSQLLNLVYLVQFLEQFSYLLSYSTLYISSSSLNSSPIFSVTQPCISRPVPWTVHLSSQLLNLVYLVQFLEQFTYLLSYSTLYISSSSLNSSPIFSVTQPCISRPVPWTVHLSSQLLNLVYLVQFLEQFTYLLSYLTLDISSSSLNSSPIFSVTQPCISRPVPWTVHLSSQLLNLVYLVQFLEQFTYLLSYSTLYISSSSLNSSPIFSVTQPCISRPVPWTVHLSSQLLNLVYLVQFLEQFTYLLSYLTLYISSSSLNSSPIFSVTQPCISRPVPWTVHLSSQLLNLGYLVQFLEQFTYLLSYSTLYISSSSLNSSPIFSVTQPCISRPVPWTVLLSSQLLNLVYLVQFLEQFTYLLSYSTLYISSSSLNSSPIFSVTQPCISRPVPWTVLLSSQLLNLVYLVQFLEQFTYLLSYSTLYISSSSLNSSPIFSVTQPCISRPVPWTVHLSSQLLNLVYLVQFLEQFTYLLSYSTLYISSSSLNSSPIFSVTQPCISRPVPWTVHLSSQLLNLVYLVQFLEQFTYLFSYSTLYISSSSLNSSPIFSVTQPCISRPVPWTVLLSSQLLNLVYLVQFLEQFTYLLSYSTLYISSSSLNSSPIFSVTQPCISRPVPWTVHLSSQLLNLVYLVQFLEQFTYLLSYSTLYISSSSLNSSPIFSVTQPCISRPVPWTVHLSSQLLNLVYLVQFLEQFTYLLSYSTLDISSSSLNSSPIFSVTQPCISRPVPWTVHLSSQLLNLVYLVQFLEQFTYLLSYSTLYISSSSLNSSPIFSVT